MNSNQFSLKMYLTLLFLMFAWMGLGGCETIQVATQETGSSKVDESEVDGVQIGIEPTPTPVRLTYSNGKYGFEFLYPETWTLTEGNREVILKNGANRLGIYFQQADEGFDPQFRAGIPAGDLIYADKINFMEQVIPVEVLLYEEKSKAVFYNGTNRIEVDNLLFMIVLEDQETEQFDEINISEQAMAEAQMIVESFKRLETRTTSASHQSTALRAILEVKQSAQLEVGEPIMLNFSLENLSESPVYLLQWYTPFEGIGGDIFVVTRDGQIIPYIGILATRGNPTAESYTFLEAGEAVSTDIDIGTAYDFSQPGLYTIKFRSPRVSHLAMSKAEMAKSLDELGPVKIPSNEVSVLVSDTP